MSDPLTGPGGFFELATESVLGVDLTVLVDRARSMRELIEASRAFDDAEFIVVDDGRRLTFADHRRHVAAFANRLAAEHQVTKGDRVAIFGANTPEWLIAFGAVTSLGAIAVAFNGWWTGDEARYALTLTTPRILIGDQKRLDRLPGDSFDGPVLRFEDDFPAETPPESPLPDGAIDEDDPALILFTSGTTGRPKGAILGHRTLVGFPSTIRLYGAQMLMASGAPMPPPSVTLVASPLFHVSGLFALVIQSLVGGTKTVWTTGRFDPETVIRMTIDEGINAWSGSGTQIYRVLNHPRLADLDTSQLSRVSVGGSATTPEMIKLQAEKLPHLVGRASSGYGSTEVGGIVSIATNADLTASADCVGTPLPTVEVRILDTDGQTVDDGIIGAVCVQSPLTMHGYWNDPDATGAAVLPDRWINTGDIGYLRDGRLHIASRERELIIRGGENIHPSEVEMRLEQHPAVLEVAVFGIDDAEFGQLSKAVVLTSGAEAQPSPGELQTFVGETLAAYKVPDIVEFATSPLPRNATGKVMKHVLATGATSSQIEE